MVKKLAYTTDIERQFEKLIRLYAAEQGIFVPDIGSLVMSKDPRVAELRERAKDFLRDIPYLKLKQPFMVVSYNIDGQTAAFLHSKIEALKSALKEVPTPFYTQIKALMETEEQLYTLGSVQFPIIQMITFFVAIPYSIKRHFQTRKAQKQAFIKVKEKTFYTTRALRKKIHA
ncbi:hypothetical protein AAIR98_001787 [Elusimicrobium simillimum]|uniref:hypothetical protein n=1 Tax=Elusimicrobium simillimum TaxID=3143438 RepID=UPI003C7006DC